MTNAPLCKKCDEPHWRFKTCEQAAGERTAVKKQGPHRTFVQREGERPWGDRLYSLDRRAGTSTFDQRSKPAAHGGMVTYPPGSGPPTERTEDGV